ncbi:ureidoglycolate lyase [Pectinatus sottacetonis]|uniref:ureidoglycolate lyase n=1 Tax=Pectinatus sottacetonis TaxID=1002795 RepID=UPI0018C590EA|nr:ureidoglycolate lyase [Pectinatus sottacetonis]
MAILMKDIPLIKAVPETIEAYGKFLGKPDRKPTLERGDIDYYHNIAPSGDFTKYPVSSFLICHKHDFILKRVERHKFTEETFIPLEGHSLMILGKKGELKEENLVAVYMDGSWGIQLYRGTWHFAPFPLDPLATFILLSGRDSGPDIEVCDVKQRKMPLPQSWGMI